MWVFEPIFVLILEVSAFSMIGTFLSFSIYEIVFFPPFNYLEFSVKFWMPIHLWKWVLIGYFFFKKGFYVFNGFGGLMTL